MSATVCSGAVVVVDDEEDARELLRELLEARGYQVVTAEDGVEALAIVQRTPRICLMILDLLMPRMDGDQVAKRLTQAGCDFPIWMSTSAPDRAPAGIPCLPKPVDIDHLLLVVEQNCAPRA